MLPGTTKIMMHLLIGLGPCPLGALRVCYQAGKNNDASSYRVGSLSPRSPFGANEKGLKDEGLGLGFMFLRRGSAAET